MRRAILALLVLSAVACTSPYQIRGTEQIYWRNQRVKLSDFVIRECSDNATKNMIPCDDERGVAIKKARQITMEHQSVEYFDGFTTGIIEISDDGDVNETQYEQVMDMVRQETRNGGLLIVFVHGWHHGPNTCDRDLTCFRRVLEQLNRLRVERNAALAGKPVVGVFIGWRGELTHAKYLNMATLHGRKDVAERIGRTVGKEILLELDDHWRGIPDLTMITVGHSLGGAFVFQAMKGKLTGEIGDIAMGKLRTYRIARAREKREVFLESDTKAKRADVGDLVVLVNPAIEADEWTPFQKDLTDPKAPIPKSLTGERLPPDKKSPYHRGQMPVLMTVASSADKAVALGLPPARALEGLRNLRPRWLIRPEMLLGMGRYRPYVTHELTYCGTELPQTKDPDLGSSPTCDCPMSYAGVTLVSGFSLERMGERQTFAGFEIDLTRERKTLGWDPNSPYFSVFTDSSVISSHSDIFNSRFVGFLTAFIDAYAERAKTRGPKEKAKPVTE